MSADRRMRRGQHLAATGTSWTTVLGAFVAYSATFFDRLAPLFLVGLIVADLPVRAEFEGMLPFSLGLGWAAAVLVSRATAHRASNRGRIVAGGVGAAVLGFAATFAQGWVVFVVLRGLAGVLSGTTAPPITALTFAASTVPRRGLVTGIVQSAPRVGGSLVSPVVVVALATQLDWRLALRVSSVLLLLATLLLVVLAPAVRPPARRGTSGTVDWLPGGFPIVVSCAAAAVALLTWLTTIGQAGIPLLVDWLDVDLGRASGLLGSFGVGGALGAFLAPVASDRIGRATAVAGAGVLGGMGGAALVLLSGADVLVPQPVAAALLGVAGLGMGALPLVMSAIPAEAVASGDVGRALYLPLLAGEGLGAALLPLVIFAVAPSVGIEVLILASAAALMLSTLAVHTRMSGRRGGIRRRGRRGPA